MTNLVVLMPAYNEDANIEKAGVSAGLSTGFIILGVVSFMMGILASVVFKRQAFAEKDLRHYLKEINENKD